MDSIRAFQKDPNLKNPFNRARVNDIRSRGLDPAIFRQGGSIDPRTIDRLIREDVLRLQTSYRQSMYPGWASTQVGRFIFRFGHWAYDASERFVRDAAAPFAKAIRQGDMPLAGVYALRIGSVAAAQVVSEEVVREFQQLFGRQSNVASIGEIWKAFSNSNPVAAHLLLSRLGSDFVGGPVFGMFGDAAQWIGGLAKGTADTTHAFNPASPASVAYLKIMWDAVNRCRYQRRQFQLVTLRIPGVGTLNS